MICGTCHGNGVIPIRDGQGRRVGIRVCADCQGNATAHCCEGDRPDLAPLPADWWERDAIGSYNDAVQAVGAKVKAGAPLPAFFISDKPGTAKL